MYVGTFLYIAENVHKFVIWIGILYEYDQWTHLVKSSSVLRMIMLTMMISYHHHVHLFCLLTSVSLLSTTLLFHMDLPQRAHDTLNMTYLHIFIHMKVCFYSASKIKKGELSKGNDGMHGWMEQTKALYKHVPHLMSYPYFSALHSLLHLVTLKVSQELFLLFSSLLKSPLPLQLWLLHIILHCVFCTCTCSCS